MDFHGVVAQVSELLQREGRVSYRALKVQFSLDYDQLEAFKDELIEAKRLAIERGSAPVWVREAPPAEPPTMHTAPAAPPPDAQPDHPIQSAPLATTSPSPRLEPRQLTARLCDLVDSRAPRSGLIRKTTGPECAPTRRPQWRGSSPPTVTWRSTWETGPLVSLWESPGPRRCRPAGGTGRTGHRGRHGTPKRCLVPQYGARVAVRLRLRTGVAVVGTVGSGTRQEQLAMGDTPNIAARLQGLAAPNTVVLSAVTARLLHGAFALEDVGVHQLKGVAEPMPVFCVLSPGEPASDEAEPAPARLPFLVGREEELGLLLRRWEQSKAGLGQVVLLSGEAGIGKTALVEVLRTHVAREGYTCIGFRGSPYPLQRLVSGDRACASACCAWIAMTYPRRRSTSSNGRWRGLRLLREEVIPLLATLLSVPLPEGGYPALTLTPQQQRQQTLDALVTWLVEEAERRPVLAV